MRKRLLDAGAAALIGLPVVLAFFSGGFFDKPRLTAALIVWTLVGLVAVFAPVPLPRSGAGRAVLLGLFGLCAWTACSFAWAPLGGRAEDDLQRLLLYLGFMTAAAALLRAAWTRRLIEPALMLTAFVVVCYALSERVLPTLIDLDSSASAEGRLEQPLTYWNAFGIEAAIGLVLAVRLAGDPSRGRALRMAAAAAGVPLGLGVYLSYARGALGAAGVGMLVLLALAPAVRPQLRAAVTVVGATAIAALFANGLSTVKSLSARDASEGLEMLAVLLVLMAAAAVIAPRVSTRPLRVPRLPVSRPTTVLAGTVLVLVAGALVLAALEGKPEGTSPIEGASPKRLGSIDSNRYIYWEEAGKIFADHPILGLGSGGFLVEWVSTKRRFDASGDAHSLYLETAAELGIVGVCFLLVFLVGSASAVVALYRLDAGAATGLAAGLAAWAFHAGLDWDWEMPALTLMALLMVSAAIAWSDLPAPARSRPEADSERREAAPAAATIC